jgi:hypothetical protein
MDSGFNIVDFMDLPGFERCVVRLLLRETELTYPQLVEVVATLPEDQQMDQERLDAALDHLTASQWLAREGDGQQRRYRVSLNPRNGSHNRGMWDGLELESIDRHRSFQVDLEPAERMLSVRSGGKRALPAHVWDCLTDPAPEERTDTSAKKRTGRLNAPNEDSVPKIR